MGDSQGGTRGGRAEGRRRATLYSPSDARLPAVAENGEQPQGGSLLAFRRSKNGRRSRSGRQRVDWSEVRGLSRATKGAAALGVLLISVMAFRFVICLGASRLYRVSRQGLSSGTASRWLADDEALVVTSPVPSDLVEGIDVLGTACPGSFDNPVFDPHNERPRSGPAGSRVPGSSWDDSDVMYRVKAPGARQILRAYLRDPAVQLGLLVLALGAGCLTFYGVGYGPASGGAPFKVVARVLGGLTFLAVIPFLYTLWRWFGDKKYQAGPTNVRL